MGIGKAVGAGLFATAMAASPALASGITVVNGDTVVWNGRTVHLHGIDAPEADETCRTAAGADWSCGARARQQLAEAASLDEVLCEAAEAGRVICRAAGLDLAALLVKEGLARAASDYQDIEAGARAAKIGLWE